MRAIVMGATLLGLAGVPLRAAPVPQRPSVLDSAEVLYFEPRFAGMAVLKTPGGRQATRFDVDERAKTVKIRTDYSYAAPVVFDGTWALAGDTLRLSGKAKGDPVSLVLTRAAVAGER